MFSSIITIQIEFPYITLGARLHNNSYRVANASRFVIKRTIQIGACQNSAYKNGISPSGAFHIRRTNAILQSKFTNRAEQFTFNPSPSAEGTPADTRLRVEMGDRRGTFGRAAAVDRLCQTAFLIYLYTSNARLTHATLPR